MPRNPLTFGNENQTSNIPSQILKPPQSNLQHQPYNYKNIDKIEERFIINELDIDKKNTILQNSLNYKEEWEKIKAKSDADRQLTYPEVYKNQEDRLIYIICKPDGTKLSYRELLNVRGVQSFLYYSSYPKLQEIFYVSFVYNEIILCFERNTKITNFLNKLNSNGIHLLVSGRAQKEAASVLLAYLIKNAEEYELPFDSGWWKDISDNWNFAKKDELTMKNIRRKYGC